MAFFAGMVDFARRLERGSELLSGTEDEAIVQEEYGTMGSTHFQEVRTELEGHFNF